MSLAHLYQRFDDVEIPDALSSSVAAEEIEDQKLQSFEAGYQSGWDDAIKAQADDKARISSEFAQNLQDMSFSYHEALARLTTAVQPLLKQIVEKLLPRIASEALGGHILEQLSDMMREQARQPVEIVVAPQNAEAIERLTGDALSEPFVVHVEPTLGGGQAFVRVGNVEREIDLEAVIAGISNALSAVFEPAHPERDHG